MLMRYREVISLDKAEKAATMAPLRAHEMHKKAELELAKLHSRVAEKTQAVTEIASKYPLDFTELGHALDDLDLTKRRQKQLEMVIAELFGDK